MKKKLEYLAATLLASCALLSGCDVEAGRYGEERSVAEARVQAFRELYDSEKYEDIYQLGSDEMHQALPHEAFLAAAKATHAKYGRTKSTREAAASCFPNQVRLVYLTEFEGGQATEMMTWAVHHGKAFLLMYSISPGYVEVQAERPQKCA